MRGASGSPASGEEADDTNTYSPGINMFVAQAASSARTGRPGSEMAAWMPLQSVHHASGRSYGQDEGEGLWSFQADHTSGLKITEEVMEQGYLLKLIIVLILCHLSQAVHRACS